MQGGAQGRGTPLSCGGRPVHSICFSRPVFLQPDCIRVVVYWLLLFFPGQPHCIKAQSFLGTGNSNGEGGVSAVAAPIAQGLLSDWGECEREREREREK